MSVGKELFEQDLKTALKAASSAYRRKRFVIVGSAAILATHPDAPSFLRLSADIDMFPIRKLDTTNFQPGDDEVGQASAFELEAGRDKDLNFVAGLLSEGIISLKGLESFISEGCPHEDFLPAIFKNLDLIKEAL